MRQVVLAFHFLSVVYAILTGLLVLSLTVMFAVDSIDVDTMPNSAVLLLFLMPTNMISVAGLKQRKSWAYVVCFAHVAFLCSVFVYSMATSSINVTNLILFGLAALLGMVLYTDYSSGRDAYNTPS